LSILGNGLLKLYDINLKKSEKAADIPKYLQLSRKDHPIMLLNTVFSKKAPLNIPAG